MRVIVRDRYFHGALLAAAVISGTIAGPPLLAQTRAAASKTWTAPRTGDGQPDLQGVWSYAMITPVERPAKYAGREFLTDEEIAALQNQAKADLAAGVPEQKGPRDLDLNSVNKFWLDHGTTVDANRRTSLVVDPPDGRIPAFTPAAQAAETARRESYRTVAGPEDFDLNDRCIMGFNSGPPMIPDYYNNNVQLFQTKDHVVIFNEMIHAARIVPLDKRPHLPDGIRLWTGDSRGHWEGETLVVDTTNFNGVGRGLQGGFKGSGGEHLHIVERFTRTSPDALRYEFTIDDPTVYTKPWRAEMTFGKSKDRIYEYACHEGNYAIANMLSAARADEAKKKADSK